MKALRLFFLAVVCLFVDIEAAQKGFQLAPLNRRTKDLQADISHLQTMGARIFRYPIYLYYQPDLELWLDQIEAILPVCQKVGSTLVITLHSGSPPPPYPPHPLVEDHPDFARWWRAIAARLSGERGVWYDLANEPTSSNWYSVALNAARTIRRYDTRNYIVFCPHGSSTFPSVTAKPLEGIERQIVTFHFYNYWQEVQSPDASGVYPTEKYNFRRMKEEIRNVDRFRRRFNIPVYIGEVAIRKDAVGAPAFFERYHETDGRV